MDDGILNSVEAVNKVTHTSFKKKADYVLSTIPVKNLIQSIEPKAPRNAYYIANELEYRDFIIVGLLINDLKLKEKLGKPIDDNSLYIQDKSVSVGRVQLFHNWSSHMTNTEGSYWIGGEYFCQENDQLWNKPDDELISFASQELIEIGLLDDDQVLDGTVVRMPKAYPSYVGKYKDFEKTQEFTDSIENLFLIGRNGMHKYNNQDHSMLTAHKAVQNILNNVKTKQNIWDVNT